MTHLINRELRHAKQRGIDIEYDIIYKAYTENGDYDFALLLKQKGFNSKKIFYSDCDKCKENYNLSYASFNRRTENWNYCRKCYANTITNSEKWKSNNSAAQLIAQNKPEVKEKMSKALIKFWKENPEIKESMAKNVKAYYTNEKKEEKSK